MTITTARALIAHEASTFYLVRKAIVGDQQQIEVSPREGADRARHRLAARNIVSGELEGWCNRTVELRCGDDPNSLALRRRNQPDSQRRFDADFANE